MQVHVWLQKLQATVKYSAEEAAHIFQAPVCSSDMFSHTTEHNPKTECDVNIFTQTPHHPILMFAIDLALSWAVMGIPAQLCGNVCVFFMISSETEEAAGSQMAAA